MTVTARPPPGAAEQPDGDLKRLLTWAEMHIGDQYERICELEDELEASGYRKPAPRQHSTPSAPHWANLAKSS